jgi:hypothetical protein
MSMDGAERAAKADEVFIVLLKRFTAQHQMVSHFVGRSYAPARFGEHPEAQGITNKEFARAMQRLLAYIASVRPSCPPYRRFTRDTRVKRPMAGRWGRISFTMAKQARCTTVPEVIVCRKHGIGVTREPRQW